MGFMHSRLWRLVFCMGFNKNHKYLVIYIHGDAAFAAMGAWEARSEAAWAAACKALFGGGGLGGFNVRWYRYVGSRASKPVLAQVRWPRGVCQTFWTLLVDFGGLLNKLLLLGRTLLLRLWVLGRHVRKRLGRRLAKRWLVEAAWAALAD